MKSQTLSGRALSSLRSLSLALRRHRLLVGAIVGLSFLALALRNIDLQVVFATLKSTNFPHLIPALILLMSTFVLKALRWKLILEPVRNLKARSLFSMVLIGYFGNFVLPANAGELVRTFLLGRRENLSKSSILATIFIEKTLDVMTFILLLAIILLRFPLPSWLFHLGSAATLALILTGLLLAVLLRQRRGGQTLVSRVVKGTSSESALKVAGILHSFIAGLEAMQRRERIGGAFLASASVWMLLSTAFYFVGLAIGIRVPFYAYVLLMVIINFGALLPALPGRVGTLEFLTISTLAIFAIDKGHALAFVIVLRAIRLLPITLGYLYFQREGFRLGRESYGGLDAEADDLAKPRFV